MRTPHAKCHNRFSYFVNSVLSEEPVKAPRTEYHSWSAVNTKKQAGHTRYNSNHTYRARGSVFIEADGLDRSLQELAMSTI